MARYLLTCDCHETVPVEMGQAGGHVVCRCGRRLDVPTLRNLRQLPVEETRPEPKRAAWTARRGMVAALLVPAVILSLIALYIRSTEPSVPPVDMNAEHERILHEIDQLSPAEWFETWTYRYRPSTERGFTVYKNQLSPHAARHVAHGRMIQKVLLSIAGLLATIALLVAFWPASQKRRPGDRGTGR